ncbi:hypothetical protein VTK26DRAFT_9512 [Humicola hyalothermophila]
MSLAKMAQRLITTAALALLATAPGPVAAADESGTWQQCGGIGYAGPTKCVAGAVCKVHNDWYHQCIPAPATDGPSSTSSQAPVTTSPVGTTLTTSVVTSSTSTTSGSTPTSTEPGECEATGGVKYLITFGDSYSQTGFDPSGTKPSPENPLGNPPLPGWTASGGYNWVGFLTAHFNASALLTYNFAYGGATTNASLVTPYQPTVLSFVDQVAQFSESIAGKPDYAPWTGTSALFGVWMGVNDVGNSWWLAEYDELVERIMDSYFGRLQVLYDAGARNFVLLGVPPIHRTPMMQAEPPETQQAEAAAIEKYNEAIAARLAAFTAENGGVTAKIVDTAAPFNKALDNPTAYGAPDATCHNEDGVSCLWFNDYHPGVWINRLVAKAVADAWSGAFF